MTSQMRIRWKLRTILGCPFTAQRKKAVRPTWMTTYAVANAMLRDLKAMGSDEDMTKLASMIARRRNRTGNFSGSSQFVTHDVKIQTIQLSKHRKKSSS